MVYEDAKVVERSDLIVVGAVKNGSMVIVPHSHENEGRSWETHAILLVHDVLKGQCHERELPIVMSYGLDVVVDGRWGIGGDQEKPPSLPATRASLPLADTGGHTGGPRLLVEDIGRDTLWFLRRDGSVRGGDALGITDPEDVQPLRLKNYFECYLSADPEAGVRAALQRQPEIAARAVRYLQHRQIGRILREKSPAVRVERLLPYWRAGSTWGVDSEARDGIIAAGAIAGPYLTALYDQSWNGKREGVIQMWGAIRYKECVPKLIEVLQQQDRFWAVQKSRPGGRTRRWTRARRSCAAMIMAWSIPRCVRWGRSPIPAPAR